MIRPLSDIYSTSSATTDQTTPTRTAAVQPPPPAAVRNSPMRAARNYGLGQIDRFNMDFFSGSMTADQAIFGAISVARNRARWLARNHDLTRKFLIMAKTHIIGAKGIRMQSRAADLIGGALVDSEIDQQILEEAYIDFSKARNFSIDGRMDRRVSSQVGVNSLFVDGECIVRKIRGADNPYSVAFQLIDSELLDYMLNVPRSSGTNEIKMGVEVDINNKPVAYHFLDGAPATWAGTAAISTSHTRVLASEIEHIFVQERPGQTRGFSWLMAVGNRAKMLDAIETAVSIGYRVAASKMGFFKAGEGYEPPEDKDGNPISDFGDVPTDCAPGQFWELPEGLDFVAFDPGYPGANYDEYTKSLTRSMAAGLGVSYPEFGNDFSSVSYSAGQIGVHSDVALWSDFQQLWIDYFEEPVFREWLLMAMTVGALPFPMRKLAKFQRVSFQPPRRKHIDPMKTHAAQSRALGDMSRSPYDIAAENGADFEDVARDFARAKRLLEKEGLPIPQSWGAHVELSPSEVAALAQDAPAE